MVYKITCLVNQKIYIGYTKRTVEQRFKSHIHSSKNKKTKLYNAFNKYGINNFIIQELFKFYDKNEAINKEIELIKELNTIIVGYNTSNGGLGGSITSGMNLTDSHKKKISEKLKNRTFSKETRDKISNKLKEIHKNFDYKKKVRERLKGRKLSDEHKKNISKNHHDVTGKNNPFYGKKHSKESKEKISNRPYLKGKSHPLYGKTIKTSFKEGKDHPKSQQVIIDGVEYGSLSQASKILGISRCLIKKKYLNGG